VLNLRLFKSWFLRLLVGRSLRDGLSIVRFGDEPILIEMSTRFDVFINPELLIRVRTDDRTS